MAEHAKALAGQPLAIAGDFNIAPADIDVYDPEAFEDSTHVSAPERERLRMILDAGLADAFRVVEPDLVQHSWWDYRGGNFHRGLGLRIDLALVSPDLATRWSLAHEIGHLVMHASVGPDAESEANRFASEFLMPRDEIVPHLRNLSIARLAELKPLWRVSMAALIKRATDTQAVSEQQGRRLWIRMSQLAYRKNEPLPLDPEEPQLYHDLVRVHLEELGYEPEQLRRLLADPEGYWVPSDNRQLRVVK